MKKRAIATAVSLAAIVIFLLPATAAAAPVWQTVPSGTTAALSGVSMADASSGWLVGSGTAPVLRISDGVVTPVAFSPSPATGMTSVSAVSANEAWAVGGYARIVHLQGAQATIQNEIPGQQDVGYGLNSISMSGPANGLAVGYVYDHGSTRGLIYRYTSGVWTQSLDNSVTWLGGVDMVDASQGWAVGSNGAIRRYQSGGWSPQASPTTNNLNEVSMISSSEGWAVGDAGTILRYSNGTWTSQVSPTTQMLTGLNMISSSEGWAVGGSGTILHYLNGTWSAQTGGTSAHLSAVSMVAADDGWAAGMDGTVLHYDSLMQASGVGVSAQIPPALTFAVAGGTAPSGGSSSASAIDFGTVTPGTAKTGSNRLTVTCNAPTGYTVAADEDKPLTSGAFTIPDVTGDGGAITHLLAGPWANASTYGFGYTLTNVTGTPAAFTVGYKQFANRSAAEAAQSVMTGTAPAAGDVVDVGYKLNASGGQPAGTYANTLTYTATGNF